MNDYTSKIAVYRTMVTALKRQGRFRLTLSAFTIGAIVAFAASTYVRSSSDILSAPLSASSTESHSSTTPVQSSEEKQPMEASMVTLWPHGFDPPMLSRPAGQFVLVVNNRSGLDEISLVLDRVAGARLRSTQVEKKRLAWGEVIDVPAGDYLLKEENHPEWSCQITIGN